MYILLNYLLSLSAVAVNWESYTTEESGVVFRVGVVDDYVPSYYDQTMDDDVADNNEPSTMKTIKRSGVLRVGLTGDYAPYSFYDGHTFEGADVEMAQNLANYLGLRLEIVKTTWKSLTEDLLMHKFDIAMGGISINQARSNVGYFSVPVVKDGKKPIVRCEDKRKYVTIEAINQPDVRVIVNPGGTNYHFAITHFPDSDLKLFPDNRKIFHEIAEGRADVMVTDGMEVELQSQHFPGVLCPAKVTRPFDSFAKAYWMPREDDFRNEVNKWLEVAIEEVFPRALEKALKGNYKLMT